MRRVITLLMLCGLLTESTFSLRAAVTNTVFQQTLDILDSANAGLERFTLPNGMVCLLKADHSAPVVSIQIWVGTGSIHEQEYLGAGLSHAIEHMIFKGTPTREPGDISREIHAVGGRINAYTTQDRVVFFTDLPAPHWRVGFDALADAVMHADFPRAEWEQERNVILREFAMGKDSPHRVMNKLLWQTAFTTHPYRHPVIGYEDMFKTITRDDLEIFFRRHYVPDNMTLVMVGDIDPGAVKPMIHDTFTGFERRVRNPVVLPQEPRQLASREVRKQGPYNVSRLAWAYHTVPLTHPDAPVLDVLANIAGQGRSSRLVQSIVEEQRLAHEVSAWSYTPGEAGLFGISATFDPNAETAVIAAMANAVQGLRHAAFTQREIQKAVRKVLTGELSGLATMKGQATSYGSGAFFAGDPCFGETYIRRLQSITPETLHRVANTYLVESSRTRVLLTPEGRGARPRTAAPTEEVSLPARLELNNGIPLIVREDHKLPFVYLTVALRGGLLSENAATAGITAMLSELLLRGTSSRSRQEIAETVETLGGSLSAYSGYNGFGLKAKCLSGDRDIFATLLADCLVNPAFPEVEIEKQRTLQIAALQRRKEQPRYLARQTLRKAIFADHPYRWDRLGTQDALQALSRKQLQRYHAERINAGNLVVSCFGDITEREALAMANRVFAAVPAGKAPTAEPPSPTPSLPVRVEQEAPHQQAIVLAGFPGVSLFDPRYDALEVLQTAMSGLSSDLAAAVRNDRGLAYYVGATQQAGLEPGMFTLYAGTRRDAVDDVVALYRREIERVTTSGLREEELSGAKRRIIADHQMRLQHNLSVALSCGLFELYGLGYDHMFSTAERINAVTADTVRNAAVDILNTNTMAVSILLPQDQEKKANK